MTLLFFLASPFAEAQFSFDGRLIWARVENMIKTSQEESARNENMINRSRDNDVVRLQYIQKENERRNAFCFGNASLRQDLIESIRKACQTSEIKAAGENLYEAVSGATIAIQNATDLFEEIEKDVKNLTEQRKRGVASRYTIDDMKSLVNRMSEQHRHLENAGRTVMKQSQVVAAMVDHLFDGGDCNAAYENVLGAHLSTMIAYRCSPGEINEQVQQYVDDMKNTSVEANFPVGQLQVAYYSHKKAREIGVKIVETLLELEGAISSLQATIKALDPTSSRPRNPEVS